MILHLININLTKDVFHVLKVELISKRFMHHAHKIVQATHKAPLSPISKRTASTENGQPSPSISPEKSAQKELEISSKLPHNIPEFSARKALQDTFTSTSQSDTSFKSQNPLVPLGGSSNTKTLVTSQSDHAIGGSLVNNCNYATYAVGQVPPITNQTPEEAKNNVIITFYRKGKQIPIQHPPILKTTCSFPGCFT